MPTKADVSSSLNRLIKQEHGNTVNLSDMWIDANVDSFGTTVVFLDMDDKYKCYSNEWFRSVDWTKISIQEIVDKAINESPQL